MKKKPVEIFIPVLLKFKDDSIVYKDEELLLLQNSVFQSFTRNPNFKKDHCKHFEYILNDADYYKLQNDLTDKLTKLKIEIYYYHHRIVLKYSFRIISNNDIRIIRKAIKEHSISIVENIISKINNLVDQNKVAKKSRVLLYYSFIIIFVRHKIDDRIGTLTIRIFESSKFIFKHGHSHFLRISIPSIIVYSKYAIGEDLRVDIINSIYQHCLYNKKNQDLKNRQDNKLEDFKKFDKKNVEIYNTINESHLSILWQHSIDTFGGKTSDNQIQDISRKTFVFLIITVIITIISIMLTVYNFIE